jgi:hypothetical protein
VQAACGISTHTHPHKYDAQLLHTTYLFLEKQLCNDLLLMVLRCRFEDQCCRSTAVTCQLLLSQQTPSPNQSTISTVNFSSANTSQYHPTSSSSSYSSITGHQQNVCMVRCFGIQPIGSVFLLGLFEQFIGDCTCNDRYQCDTVSNNTKTDH